MVSVSRSMVCYSCIAKGLFQLVDLWSGDARGWWRWQLDSTPSPSWDSSPSPRWDSSPSPRWNSTLSPSWKNSPSPSPGLRCGAPNCAACRFAGDCKECHSGYTLVDGRCDACASHCHTCDDGGSDFCDHGSCNDGYFDRQGEHWRGDGGRDIG